MRRTTLVLHDGRTSLRRLGTAVRNSLRKSGCEADWTCGKRKGNALLIRELDGYFSLKVVNCTGPDPDGDYYIPARGFVRHPNCIHLDRTTGVQ